MNSETQVARAEPEVAVNLRADGTGEMVVNGISHEVRHDTLDLARPAVLAHVAKTYAAPSRGPVYLRTTDPSGQWDLLVHHDGRVQPLDQNGPPAPLQVLDQPLGESVPKESPSTTEVLTAEQPIQPGPAVRPTLDDLIAARPPAPTGPAQQGWQATVRLLTGGLIKPGPGSDELEHRDCVSSVQRSLNGPKTIVVVNPKGGGTKTTATIMLAATFGIHRGGYTLAWDNNETRGTLGWRAAQARHTNTAVDLLRDLERFTDVRSARVGDLDNYVRSQGSAQFDVLASDEDAASAASIDAQAFNHLHRTLARFYRVLVVDTGNNMRASNWQAAIEAADQLVIVSTVREDTAQSAAWLIDALRATGQSDAVEQAVTVLAAPARTADPQLSRRLHDHFGALTRTVLDVPHDPVLVPGGPIAYDALNTTTQRAWLRVSAAVAEGL